MKHALLDVSKSNGNPMLSFPEDTVTVKEGDVWTISYRDYQMFVKIVWQNAARWIAVAAAPKVVFVWLAQNLGVGVHELTWQFWQDNKTQLQNIGLVGEIRGGVEVLRVPHVICGQVPYVVPEMI